MQKKHRLNRFKCLSTVSLLAGVLLIPATDAFAAASASANTNAQIIIVQKDEQCYAPAGKSKDGKITGTSPGCECNLNGQKVNIKDSQWCTSTRTNSANQKRIGK